MGEEIMTLQQMLDTGQENGESVGEELNDGSNEVQKLKYMTRKLQDEVKEARHNLKQSDSSLKTAKLELIQKEKEKNDLEGNLNKKVEDLEMAISSKDEEISEIKASHNSQFEGLKNLLSEKDRKLQEYITQNELQSNLHQSVQNEVTKVTSKCSYLEQQLESRDAALKTLTDQMKLSSNAAESKLQQEIDRLKSENLNLNQQTSELIEQQSEMKENENCLTKSKENLESDIKIYIEKLEEMEQKIALSEKKNENI